MSCQHSGCLCRTPPEPVTDADLLQARRDFELALAVSSTVRRMIEIADKQADEARQRLAAVEAACKS